MASLESLLIKLQFVFNCQEMAGDFSFICQIQNVFKAGVSSFCAKAA
jgi:hypothetical protein